MSANEVLSTRHQRKMEELSRLVSLCSKVVPLKPHELVLTRREGLVHSTTAEDIALNDCPYDLFLGLRWYRSDPLPSIICAHETDANRETKFTDNEFPVHNRVHLNVTLPNRDTIECIPGVITSSNCRDFVTVPKRVPRIQHFTNKANCVNGGWSWKRASCLNDGACALFSSFKSIDPRNVLQGKVGNCGFCSGISSIAAGFSDIIRDAFGDNAQITLSKYGAVSVLLYPRGQPRYLLMDDYILCKNERYCIPHNGRNPLSPSMHSLLATDVWVRLLEKAFVKVQGSYASLDGYYKYNSLYRHPARAMQLLTGAALALELHYETADEDIMYKLLLSTQGRFAKVVHCRKRLDGLIPNHGYSLLWVGEGGGEHWVCLRNPHGQGSYKGHGFDGSLFCSSEGEHTLPKCFQVCDKTRRIIWKQESFECHPAFSLQDCNHDNGIFFITFRKFVECFPITTLVGPIESNAINNAGNASPNAFDETSDNDCVHEVHRSDLENVYKTLKSSQV